MTFAANPQGLVSDADIVVSVQPPSAEVLSAMKEGSVLLTFVYAHREPDLVKLMRDRKITCFAMELVPRITRAQAMDALSSQAALAGYYGALLGATSIARMMPMTTFATGSIRPGTILVMGVGVAGLSAIATARRIGAKVEGYDVRPEVKEQVESLGAKFIDTGVDARGTGGYARELTQEEKDKIAQVVTKHIQSADIIITTAAIPGRPSPKLISKAQVDGMKAGALTHLRWLIRRVGDDGIALTPSGTLPDEHAVAAREELAWADRLPADSRNGEDPRLRWLRDAGRTPRNGQKCPCGSLPRRLR